MLGRKTTLVVLNSVLGGILGYVALKLVALYMGAGPYGQLGFATSLVGTVSFLTDLGFNTAHQKRLSEGEDPGACMSTYIVIVAGLATLYVTVVLGGLLVNHLFIGRRFISTTTTALLLITLANTAQQVGQIARTSFVARLEVARKEVVIFSEHLVRGPSMIIFALFYASARNREGAIFEFLRDTAPDLGTFILAHGADFLALSVFLASFLSMIVGLALVLRHLPRSGFDWDMFGSYTSFAIPVALTGVANTIASYIDKATVGFFWGDVDTGQYFGVERLLVFLNVINLAVGSLLFPSLSEHHSQGNHEAARRLMEASTRYISMVAVPAAVGISVLAEPFIRILLSNEWLAATGILAVLAAMSAVKSLTQPVTAVIYGYDRPLLLTGIETTTTILNVGTTLILVPASLFGVPLFGLKGIGAAIGSLLASCLGLVLKLAYAPVKPSARSWIRPFLHLIAASVMGGVVWLFHTDVFMLTRWFHIPIHVGLGAAVYLLVLLLLGEFERKDLNFFWAAIHPGEMGSYIRDELRPGEREEE